MTYMNVFTHVSQVAEEKEAERRKLDIKLLPPIPWPVPPSRAHWDKSNCFICGGPCKIF